MSFAIKFPELTPRRILIHGPQGSGKSTFAHRLAGWLHAKGHAAVLVDSADQSAKRRGSGCITIDTIITKPTSRQRDRYDWIIDMEKRPARVDGVCEECRGNGEWVSHFIKQNRRKGHVMILCHGDNCALNSPSCRPIGMAAMASDPKSSTVDVMIGDANKKLIEAVTGKPQEPAPSKLPSVLEKMKQREQEASEGRAQLNAVRRVINHDFSQEPHIPSVLAADIAFDIERLTGDLDLMMTALDTRASLNASARDEIRSSVKFDLSRLRSRFGGLKALILQEGELHRIHSAPCPF